MSLCAARASLSPGFSPRKVVACVPARPPMSPNTEVIVHAVTAGLEVRLATALRQECATAMKQSSMERRLQDLEAQLQTNTQARLHAEARWQSWEQRAIVAESQAKDSRLQQLAAEAHASIAESDTTEHVQMAEELGEESADAMERLAIEMESRIAAETRALVAEGTVQSLEAQLKRLAQDLTYMDALVADNIRAVEKRAEQRVKDAEKREGLAERMAQSCETTSSTVLSKVRNQMLTPTALSPRRSLRPVYGWNNSRGSRSSMGANVPAILPEAMAVGGASMGSRRSLGAKTVSGSPRTPGRMQVMRMSSCPNVSAKRQPADVTMVPAGKGPDTSPVQSEGSAVSTSPPCLVWSLPCCCQTCSSLAAKSAMRRGGVASVPLVTD